VRTVQLSYKRDVINQCKFLEIRKNLCSGHTDQRESREEVDALDGRKSGVVSPGDEVVSSAL
jgi:hypothetical protein